MSNPEVITVIADEPIEINPGDQVEQDPEERLVYAFDYRKRTAAGTYLLDEATFTIDAPDGATLGNQYIGIDDGNRVLIRLGPASARGLYRVACKVVTLENPSQTWNHSFFLKIE